MSTNLIKNYKPHPVLTKRLVLSTIKIQSHLVLTTNCKHYSVRVVTRDWENNVGSFNFLVIYISTWFERKEKYDTSPAEKLGQLLMVGRDIQNFRFAKEPFLRGACQALRNTLENRRFISRSTNFGVDTPTSEPPNVSDHSTRRLVLP